MVVLMLSSIITVVNEISSLSCKLKSDLAVDCHSYAQMTAGFSMIWEQIPQDDSTDSTI